MCVGVSNKCVTACICECLLHGCMHVFMCVHMVCVCTFATREFISMCVQVYVNACVCVHECDYMCAHVICCGLWV